MVMKLSPGLQKGTKNGSTKICSAWPIGGTTDIINMKLNTRFEEIAGLVMDVYQGWSRL